MRIDEEKCVGCYLCLDYCPTGAIQPLPDEKNPQKRKSGIDEDECMECGVCLRSGVCRVEAIYMPSIDWPRTIRQVFSDPMVEHKNTGVPGRGTEEMKTNEVSGRFKKGAYGMAVEVGRPGIGARLEDLETVAMALAKIGITFEPRNPVNALFEDVTAGRLKPELRKEKVISAIIEFEVQLVQIRPVLRAVKEASAKVNCLFSVDLISFPGEEEKAPALQIVKEMGFPIYPNGKVNLGLGKVLNR